ncbi:hypothetical protein BLS_004043 [Venturia inaequalis]|uniref:Uncharacterized protein n=1 Tax=Venturia inaequalis TaxID=5025 RepID=A0A8H3YSV3_VENIN|nr:hypothetical protein BLS_004043 [Venturia inaequalis]
MNSVFPDRFWSQNPVQQDPQNRSIDETWNTKTSNLERPLPPLPVSTHSRDNSANEDPFSSPLEQFYRQHSSQYQQKLNQSQQSFPTKLSLSNATSVDSFSFEKGQGRAGLKGRRTRLEALVDSFSPYFSDWWLGEILCWVAGTLCIGAIILVLALYDGQPVPSRWPLGITLNAFISVISAVGKFSLAVPVNECIGELKWICSIASIGATITILTLALDPVFQQIVTYPQRPRANGKSSIARVVVYNPPHYSYLVNGSKYTYAPDALYNAIGGVVVNRLGSDVLPAPVFCPSDDCRWPSFQTLAVCSQCEDVSQYLTFGCLQDPGDWKADYARKANATDYPKSTSCGYFLNATSDAPMLMSGYSVSDVTADGVPGEALAARTLNLHDFDSGVKYWDGSLRFKSKKVPIMDFLTAGIPDGDSPYVNSTPIAMECVLKWCVKTIESTFVNGDLSEKVISTFENNTQTIPDRLEWNASQNRLNRFYHNESLTPSDQDTTFSVSNQTTLEFALALSSVSPASLTTTNLTAPYRLKYQILTGQPTKSILTNFTAMRPPENVTANVEKLAAALTDVMRSNQKSTEPVFGTGSFEVFIHVRYGWLTLPLIIVVATLVFLVATIRKASREQAGIWKTSSLATLMHGLSWDAKTHGDGGSLWRMEDMKNRSNSLSVYLDRYKEGGTLDCVYQPLDHKSY